MLIGKTPLFRVKQMVSSYLIFTAIWLSDGGRSTAQHSVGNVINNSSLVFKKKKSRSSFVSNIHELTHVLVRI